MSDQEKILIVDDDEGIAQTLAFSLQRLGYVTVVVGTGADAIARMRAVPYNVALIDIKLPDVDGVNLLAALRTIRPDTALIVVTGYASLETALMALNSGAAGYIIKPFKIGEVLDKVKDVLEHQRLIVENRRLYHEIEQELIGRKRTEEVERQQRALAEALRHTAEALASTLSLEDVLDLILAEAGRVVPHDTATVMLIEEDVARAVRSRGYVERGLATWVLSMRLPIAEMYSLCKMMETGQPLVIPDTHRDSGWTIYPQTSWIRSYVGAPIRAKGRVIGFVNLNSPVPGFFNATYAERLQYFADQAGVAIENARLYSSLQATNTQLQEALRAKDEMIQNVSHELRTPLSLLKGYIELMESGSLGSLNTGIEQAMQVMHRQADRLHFMVNRLLVLQTFSVSSLRLIEFDLGRWLRDAMRAWNARVTSAGLRLRLDVAPMPIAIRADPQYLGQIIENLLDNAIKFSPNGGTVTVMASIAAGSCQPHALAGNGSRPTVILAVADEGIGIPQDKLERVFDRFFQAAGGATRPFGGMGIGLSLCRAIVQGHGGQIWVESKGEGRGSVFYVALPLAESDPT